MSHLHPNPDQPRLAFQTTAPPFHRPITPASSSVKRSSFVSPLSCHRSVTIQPVSVSVSRTTRCCVESSNAGQNPLFNERGEALVRAAMLGDTNQVNVLLSSSPPNNTLDVSYESVLSTSRMTALMWAAAEGHAEIVRALLSAGAASGVNVRNANGDAALLLAMENMPNTKPFPAPPPGFPGATNFSSSSSSSSSSSPFSSPPSPSSNSGPRPGEKVVVSGHVEVVNLLLEHGADVSIRTSDTGESLLHIATKRGQIGIMRQLLARGLQPNDNANRAQETALHVAARQAHEQATTLLCNLGADLNARNVFGWTPLLWAAASGWENIVEILLQHKADVNVRAKGGRDDEETTALKEARKSTRPDSISRLLIRAGAKE